MKIIITTNDGRVIATYDGVEWWDAREESPHWRAILSWLLRALQSQRPPRT